MTERSFDHFLTDIIEAMQSAIKFTDGLELAQFISDQKTYYAVIHCFEIIGEATKHIPLAIKEEFSNVPWRLMNDMRNRVIHGYFSIDDEILLTTAKEDLVPVIISLENMIEILRLRGNL